VPTPRIVQENPAHQPRGDREKVRAVAPVDAPLIDELHIRLVDERGGLKHVIAPLAREMPRRDDAQLVVDERHQPVERLAVASLPLLQQLGNLRRRRGGFGISGHGGVADCAIAAEAGQKSVHVIGRTSPEWLTAAPGR